MNSVIAAREHIASYLIMTPGFTAHSKSRTAYYKPFDAGEEVLVNQIIRQQWRLLRLKRLQSALHNATFVLLGAGLAADEARKENLMQAIPQYLNPLLNRQGVRIRFRNAERRAKLEIELALFELGDMRLARRWRSFRLSDLKGLETDID